MRETIKRTVIGMDPHWWESDPMTLTVEDNPTFIGSLGESTAAVVGSCGDAPDPLVTVPMDPPVKIAGDRDPRLPLAKAVPASLDPQSFGRYLLDL